MNEIKRIYLGLPEFLKSSVFWVGRKFRTNILSHQPGGGDIIVEYHSGKVFGYDWIKYPSKYVVNIFNRHFSKTNEDFENYKEYVQLGIIKKEVARLFARIYEEDEFETVNFEEVWNSSVDDELPWVKLQEFEDLKYEERKSKQEAEKENLRKQRLAKAEEEERNAPPPLTEAQIKKLADKNFSGKKSFSNKI